MTSTRSAVATELLKMRTVRTPAVLGLLAFAVTLVLTVQPIIRAGTHGAPSVGTAGLMLTVLAAPEKGALAMLVVGVWLVTVERRFGTLTVTLLETPGRVQLIQAKLTVGVMVAIGVAVVNLGIILLLGIFSGAITAPLINRSVLLIGFGTVVTYPLYAILGVAIGALLSGHQAAAVLIPMAWLLLVEGYVAAVSGPLAAWFPGRLASAWPTARSCQIRFQCGSAERAC